MKITCNLHGNWRLYTTALPEGAEALGTVTRDGTDTGALVRLSSGNLVQVNAGVVRTLPPGPFPKREEVDLTDRFFADCKSANLSPNAEQLKAWLWFTCPANMRHQTRQAIESDPRFTKS